MKALLRAHVAVFGVGGVGGYAVEALARSGVGALDLIDSDVICPSNLNRQIIATTGNIGEYKVDAARQRVLEINPGCKVKTYRTFFTPATADEFDFGQYDYVIDAIDTVTGKIELAVRAKNAGVPLISSMGAGNKMDPTAFEVADVYKTSVCPLARVMRRELKKRGVESLKVVYSKEPPLTPDAGASSSAQAGESPDTAAEKGTRRRQVPGSNAFVPSVVGLIIAGEVVKDLIGYKTISS